LREKRAKNRTEKNERGSEGVDFEGVKVAEREVERGKEENGGRCGIHNW
jgi:hypothetical protein